MRGIRVQAAALRSETEANRVAGSIVANLGAKLGQRTAAVDTQSVGNMGTFHRVVIGPFASEADTGEVCRALRAAGHDCLVVKN